MAEFSNGAKLRRIEARSSGGERYLDAVEVWGSNPHVPTTETNLLKVKHNLLEKHTF